MRFVRPADDLVFGECKIIRQFLRQMGGACELTRRGTPFGNDPTK
jgi:hypothetical protein